MLLSGSLYLYNLYNDHNGLVLCISAAKLARRKAEQHRIHELTHKYFYRWLHNVLARRDRIPDFERIFIFIFHFLIRVRDFYVSNFSFQIKACSMQLHQIMLNLFNTNRDMVITFAYNFSIK